MDTSKIISLLGDESEFLLNHFCKTIDKSQIHTVSLPLLTIFGHNQTVTSRH